MKITYTEKEKQELQKIKEEVKKEKSVAKKLSALRNWMEN